MGSLLFIPAPLTNCHTAAPEIDQVRNVIERQVTAEHGFALLTMQADDSHASPFSTLPSVTLNVNTRIHMKATSECQAGMLTAAFCIFQPVK